MGPNGRSPRWGLRGLFASHSCIAASGADAVALAGVRDRLRQLGPVQNWGLQGKHMVALPSGKVLVWSNGNSARIWDPAAGPNGGFTANTPAVFGDLHCAGNATLADGRTIVLGGQNGAPTSGSGSPCCSTPPPRPGARRPDGVHAVVPVGHDPRRRQGALHLRRRRQR